MHRSAGGMRRGYMGHLTRIANTVVHNLEKGPVHAQIGSLISGEWVKMSPIVIKVMSFQHFLVRDEDDRAFVLLNAAVFSVAGVELPEDCRGRWETFVDQTLSEANRKNTIDLVIIIKMWFCIKKKMCFCSLKMFWFS